MEQPFVNTSTRQFIKNCEQKVIIDLNLPEGESFSFFNKENKMIKAIVKALVPIKATVTPLSLGCKFIHRQRCHNFYVKKV